MIVERVERDRGSGGTDGTRSMRGLDPRSYGMRRTQLAKSPQGPEGMANVCL